MKLCNKKQEKQPATTRGEKRMHPPKAENERLLFSSNGFCLYKFIQYGIDFVAAMVLFSWSLHFLVTALYRDALDVWAAVCLLFGVVFLLRYGILAVREWSYHRRDRPTYLEVYQNHVEGRGGKFIGAGAETPVFFLSSG